MGFFDNVGTLFDMLVNSEEYSDTGKAGERFTYRVLDNQYLKKQIFRNLYIKRSSGKYTEIDLVTVGQGALIVYESKNYSGWIFGNDSGQHWTQSFPNGKKQKFYNPVFQNNTHIEALKEYLIGYPLEYHSIIVFSERCELKKIECTTPNTHIIKRDSLDKTVSNIRKKTDLLLSKQQLDEVIVLLSKVQRPDDDIKEKHLENIKDTISTCPRCGGEMVERVAKATGSKFLGCKNYPKCRFTREI